MHTSLSEAEAISRAEDFPFPGVQKAAYTLFNSIRPTWMAGHTLPCSKQAWRDTYSSQAGFQMESTSKSYYNLYIKSN